MDIQSICVFCGSSAGEKPEFEQAARDLGKLFAEREIRLVYGGGNVGLMGAVADAALENGGKVTGIIPDFLVRKEVAHNGLTELVTVDSMHTRKLKMAEAADAFITLPGGFGTFEELFEAITWGQLGLHEKPIGILNVAGFYDDLSRFIDHVVANNFVKEAQKGIITWADNPAAMIDALFAWQPCPTTKWIHHRKET